MGRKLLLWASLIIILAVIVNEIFWLGKTSLAWVIIGISVALGLQVVYLLSKEVNMKIRPLYVGLLVFAIVLVAVGMKFISPTYSADEVKSVVFARCPSLQKPGLHVEYDWRGKWLITRLGEKEPCLIFNEDTGLLNYPEELLERQAHPQPLSPEEIDEILK